MTRPRSPEEILAAGEVPTLEGLEAWRIYQAEQKEKAELERREHFDKENARRSWIAAGNDPSDFELSWPAMHQALEQRRAEDQQALDETLVYSAARNVF